MKTYQLKYVRYGHKGARIYGVLRIKSDKGWIVEAWPCDMEGAQVSDPIMWQDELGWLESLRLFWKWYKELNKYVNKQYN